MRRTRIIVTAGPASDDPETIGELIAAGVDVFRLNFSHGTIAGHAAVVSRIREVSKAAGRQIAILQDLGGPKIRTGPLAAPLMLVEGESLVIEHGDFEGKPGLVSCNFEALFTSVSVGQRLLINDGRIELEVTAVAPGRLTTHVIVGGPLDAHKGINVPNAPIRTSAMMPKDIEDLRAGIAMGVDLVALSFVQSPDDVLAARALASSLGASDLPIIARSKTAGRGADRGDPAVVDGLMVARGDLGSKCRSRHCRPCGAR
jgi:pyruvate kinase